MHLRHTAALALVGWYLMMPPCSVMRGFCNTTHTVASSVFGSTKAFVLARGLSVKPYEVLSASCIVVMEKKPATAHAPRTARLGAKSN
jgi:hypothetical protein